MLNNYYYFISQYNLDAIADCLMELIKYSKDNSDYQLLRGYLYDEVASVLIPDMIEEEKGYYILRKTYDWYERYLSDYAAFIDDILDPPHLKHEGYMASEEGFQAGIIVEYALILMGMTTEDMHYSYAVDFLEDRISQDYFKLEDVKLSHSLVFKRIMEATRDHLEYLKEIEEELDTFQVVVNGLPDRGDANDASHP